MCDEKNEILEFIEVYRSLPAIWDVKSAQYSDRNIKDVQYEVLLNCYKKQHSEGKLVDVKKKLMCSGRISDGNYGERTIWKKVVLVLMMRRRCIISMPLVFYGTLKVQVLQFPHSIAKREKRRNKLKQILLMSYLY